MGYFLAGCIFILLLQNHWKNRSKSPEINYHRQNLEKLRHDDRWTACDHEYLNVFQHKTTKMLLYDFEEGSGFEIKLKMGLVEFKESLGKGPLNMEALETRCITASSVLYTAQYSL